MVPAFRAAAVDPGTLLKQTDMRTASRRSHRWRNAFVAAQLALAVVVLGVAAAGSSSLRDAVNRDRGYRSAGVWTARVALPSPDVARRDGARIYAQILSALRDHAGITDVALMSAVPIGDLPTTLVSPETVETSRRMAS